jgi:hypothetical protein
MYPYTCFNPRILKKSTITSTAYFEACNSTHVLIFVLKYLNIKIVAFFKKTLTIIRGSKHV